MRVRWKPYQGFNIDGEPCIMPSLIDENVAVLEKIKAMPRKKPLTYVQAQVLYWTELAQSILDEKNYLPLGQEKAIDWLSSQGYHIELKGDEFELF